MKIGDLVKYNDNMHWTHETHGLVVAMRLPWPNVEILWSGGQLEIFDSQCLEVINEDR